MGKVECETIRWHGANQRERSDCMGLTNGRDLTAWG